MKCETVHKKQLMNFNPMGEILTASIRVALPTIAICFRDTMPAGIRNWTGRVPAGCRFWQRAATEVFATSSIDHDLCAIGTCTHYLKTTEAHDADRRDGLKVLADLGYVREQDIASIPMPEFRPSHVINGPLTTMPLVPDVVLLFQKVNQILVLSEAPQQVEGGLSPAMGRPAGAIVPQADNTGREGLSLGCSGALLTDDVALWAIPGARLGLYAERIEVLANANAVLTTFDRLRREEVEDGKSPTIKKSLAAMASRN